MCYWGPPHRTAHRRIERREVRRLLSLETMRSAARFDNEAFRRAATASDAGISPTATIKMVEALRWASVEGARMLGQLDRIGTLAPGKQADLVLIDARLPNMQPLHDPINAALMQTSLANIDSVMVAGRWRKRGGRLVDERQAVLDPETWLAPLRESGRRMAASVGWRPRHASTTPGAERPNNQANFKNPSAPSGKAIRAP